MKILRHASMIFFILFSCGAFSGALGQKNTLLPRDEFLASFKKLSDHKGLLTQFRQTKNVKRMDLNLLSEGTLEINNLARGKKTIIWKVEKPHPLTVRIENDEITLRSTIQGVETVQKHSLHSSPGGHQASVGILHWLRMDPQELYDLYRVTRIGTRTYHFTPKETNPSLFSSIEITLNEDSRTINKMKLAEKNGDMIDLVFSNPRTF